MVSWKLFCVCWFFFYCLRFAFWKFLWMKVFKGRPDHNNRSAYRYRCSAPKVESLDPLPRMPRGVWVMCVATGKSLNVIPIHKHNHSHNQNPSTQYQSETKTNWSNLVGSEISQCFFPRSPVRSFMHTEC